MVQGRVIPTASESFCYYSQEVSNEISERSAVPLPKVTVQAPLNSCSEFGKLRSVVVGSAVGANHPRIESSFKNFFTWDEDADAAARAQGAVPQSIVDEIEEDIAEFIKVLVQRGVEVLRPQTYDSTALIKSPDWETEQLYSLMPRDCVFVHGRLYLEVPSPARSRFFEPLAFRDIAHAYRERSGSRALVLSAPKPRLLEDSFEPMRKAFLPNTEPMFDAANCVRLGRDIFMDINNSANMAGLHWLQDLFAGLSWDVKIHPMHIGEDHADVTLVPLRPGVILVDEKRTNPDNLPKQFKNWTQVRLSSVPEQPYGLTYPMASNGIGRNVFVLDEKTIVVEKNQSELIAKLEALDFEVIPLRYRHGRTLGGSWHCITLDTNRDGGFEDYL
jgi:glycine amidinotransferase